MLRVDKINAFYGQAHILFDLSLDVKPGEVVVLLGPQWCGQIHDDENHHGPRSRNLRRRCIFRTKTSPAVRRTR